VKYCRGWQLKELHVILDRLFIIICCIFQGKLVENPVKNSRAIFPSSLTPLSSFLLPISSLYISLPNFPFETMIEIRCILPISEDRSVSMVTRL
jgi:hypothetical protein